MAKFFRNWRAFVLVMFVSGILLLALSGYLNSIINTSLRPLISVQTWFYTRFQAVYEFLSVPKDVATLRQRNAELENENSQLQNQVIQLEQQLREASVLYALLDFAREHPENAYVAAAVIGRDPSPFLHYVIIDHGSDSGLRHGMPVVTQQGLVGRIDAVTAGAARVQLITDASSAINVYLKSSDTDGLLSGSITGDISVGMISQDVILQTGDLVLTSGLGGDYPSDVLIGQLSNLREASNTLFQTASIQPAVDFANLKAILVITNFKPVDILPLTPTQTQ